MNFSRTALHALKWSALGELASRFASGLALLVLARLLAPGDFGVVAAATVIISLSQVFADAGLDKALIQRRDRIQESAGLVFWLNLALGIGLASLLMVFAPWIAEFFHDARIAAVVRLLSLQIPLGSLSLVQSALLKRELRFKRLFWVRLSTTTAGALVSVPLALGGMGYWALVAGTLLGQVAQAIALWSGSEWRPSLEGHREVARELLSFGGWAMLSGLLSWFYGWMDAVVVGHYLGARELGLYRTGNTFVVMIFALMFSPTLPVLYSLFSRAQDHLEGLRTALTTVSHAIALAAFPAAAFLIAAGGRIEQAFFGHSWVGIGRVLAILGVMHAVSWVVGANGEVYRAIGKPHVETWTTASMLLVYATGYLVSVRYGLGAFLWVRLGLALAAFCVHVGVASVVLGLGIRSWLHLRSLAIAVVAGLLLHAVIDMPANAFLAIALAVPLFGLFLLGGVALLERTFVLRLVRGVREGAAR